MFNRAGPRSLMLLFEVFRRNLKWWGYAFSRSLRKEINTGADEVSSELVTFAANTNWLGEKSVSDAATAVLRKRGFWAKEK